MKVLALIAALLLSTTLSARSPVSIASDPPVDSKNPASLVEIAVPSHGVQLLGAFYLAAGADVHPTAILFHGFPGYEQNLDLAQALRRSGYNVLAVHYRGSWGIKGEFSFTHVIEDGDAQVEWLSSPGIAARYRIDTARIILIGHSMGGFVALSAAAHNPKVRAAVLISAASLAHRFAGLKPQDQDRAVAQYVSQVDPADLLPLAGTTAPALGAEIFAHREDWDFTQLAAALGKRPVLLITANDGTGPNSEALYQLLKRAGNTHSAHLEIKTDHPFSDHRIALESDIIDWLQRQQF